MCLPSAADLSRLNDEHVRFHASEFRACDMDGLMGTDPSTVSRVRCFLERKEGASGQAARRRESYDAFEHNT